jgi:putative GTP pyrophosphokinase
MLMMTNKEIRKRRDVLASFIETNDYVQAVGLMRDILRSHLLRALGVHVSSDWERVHYEYGLYTINCRVKSSKRILEKFDRLATKGEDVSVKNFFKLMPDLVGGRLVAVDPGDLFKLASRVKDNCGPPNFLSPQADFKQLRVRHGKFSMYEPEPFSKAGYIVDVEDTGYCSVHFVFRVGPEYFTRWEHERYDNVVRLSDRGQIDIKDWHVEVQVRTIMDDAWGEVDHFIRYEDPKLREDPDMKTHCAALAGFLQAANHHVRLIREAARRPRNVA